MNERSYREFAGRRQPEEELQGVEAHHKAIIENVADAIVINVGTERVFVNKAFVELLGLDDESQVLGTPLDHFIVPEDRQLVRERTLARQSSQPVPGVYEYRIQRRDGEVRTVQTSSAPITYKGTPAVLAVLRDITERRQVEEALRQSEGRYRDLYEEAPSAYYSVGVDGRIIRANRRAVQLFGYTIDELIGRVVFDLVADSPTGKRRAHEVFQRFVAGQETHGEEIEFRRADGSQVWGSLSVRPIRDDDGQILASRSMIIDITERKRAEEALRQSEERFELAVRGASDGIWDWDNSTDKEWWSPRLYELLGYQEGEIEATHAKFIELLHPDDKDRTLEAMRAHLDDRVRYDVEIRLRTKSGEYRWFRSRGQALWDETERPVRMAGSIQDITDRKRAEEALRASSQRLVEAQETERRHIARELHDEIGQGLTGLKLTLEMSSRSQTGRIGESLGEATAVVNDIMGKVRQLSLSLRPPMLDDFGLLPALLCLFKQYTARTNVHVRSNLAGLEGRRFHSDIETAAYRIVQEALTNIARHAYVREATVIFWTDPSTLYVQIRDHGTGFDPAAVQASRTCTGLAGMRERVRLLNGRFTLESAPGAGTQLTAELPLNDSLDRGPEDGQDIHIVGG